MGKFESHKPEKKRTLQQDVILSLHDLIYLLAVVIIVLLLLFRIVIVSGDSMNATLVDGDYLLLISNTLYTEPQQGDIIVASKESFENGEPIIKRVIATGGQSVDINFVTGVVYVDGIALDEPYALAPTITQGGMQFPLKVEEGCVFVMGDNRNFSRDSRFPEIGLIDKQEILGKAVFLMMPGTDHGEQRADFSRIGALS